MLSEIMPGMKGREKRGKERKIDEIK